MRGRPAFLTGSAAIIQSGPLTRWVRMLEKIDQRVAGHEWTLLQFISSDEVHRRVDDLAILHGLTIRIESKIADRQQQQC